MFNDRVQIQFDSMVATGAEITIARNPDFPEYDINYATIMLNSAPWSSIMTFCAYLLEDGYCYLASASQDRVILRMFSKAYQNAS